MAVAGAAKRYARAAFDIAKDQGTIDIWEQALAQLVEVVQDPRVSGYFQSPAVPEESKRQSLASILPGTDQQYVRNLALLLLDRDRLQQLPQVVEGFHDLVLEERRISVVEVTTAVDLQPSELQLVSQQLKRMIGNEIQLRSRVDPAIIGGIVIRYGDTLIDGSVQSQLRVLRQRMSRSV